MSRTGFHPGDGGPPLERISDFIVALIQALTVVCLVLLVVAVWV